METKTVDEVVKELKLISLMTLYTDPATNKFYVTWSEAVPEAYKMQMRATFGAFITELNT